MDSAIESESVPSMAEEAFQAAVKKIIEDGEHIERILQNAATLQDIQEVVRKSMHQYKAIGKNLKTIKWLNRTTKSIVYYSRVFDVFAPQNPQYVSLAFGAMKFLFTVSNI